MFFSPALIFFLTVNAIPKRMFCNDKSKKSDRMKIVIEESDDVKDQFSKRTFL